MSALSQARAGFEARKTETNGHRKTADVATKQDKNNTHHHNTPSLLEQNGRLVSIVLAVFSLVSLLFGGGFIAAKYYFTLERLTEQVEENNKRLTALEANKEAEIEKRIDEGIKNAYQKGRIEGYTLKETDEETGHKKK